MIDDTGARLSIASPVRRIVSLAPHTTELLFAAGAGGQVVAASEYSDFPEAARSLPSIGSYRGMDLERIAALKPDLVVAWESGNSAGQVAAIEKMGIPVFRSEPKALEQIATSLERLGVLTGHRYEAGAAAALFRRRVAALRLRYAGLKPIRVFYQVWNRPLMTIGGHHLISSVLALCGGPNIFAQIEAPSSVIDAEAVVAADPQLMIVASPVRSGTAVPESLGMWTSWKQISAVRNGQYASIDPALITRATPRLVEGAEQLCWAIDKARQAPP